MVTTESYGGTCPNCGYTKTLIRYGTYGWFLYDACPNCGFAYGANSLREFKGKEVWEILFKHFDVQSIKTIKDMVENWGVPDVNDDPKQVFDYGDEIEPELIWKDGSI